MRIIADFIREILLNIRRWFFKFIPEQSYLYMACGGINLVFDMAIFFLSYHFIFHEKNRRWQDKAESRCASSSATCHLCCGGTAIGGELLTDDVQLPQFRTKANSRADGINGAYRGRAIWP